MSLNIHTSLFGLTFVEHIHVQITALFKMVYQPKNDLSVQISVTIAPFQHPSFKYANF